MCMVLTKAQKTSATVAVCAQFGPVTQAHSLLALQPKIGRRRGRRQIDFKGKQFDASAAGPSVKPDWPNTYTGITYAQARLSTVFSNVAPGTTMFHLTVQL